MGGRKAALSHGSIKEPGMARIGWVEFADAEGRIRDLYLEEAAGRPDVAGIVKSFSRRVEALEGMMRFSEVHFGPGGALGRARREMIATYVSALNGCWY
jgi:alkylhydroperoxidase family enzyme